MSCIYTQELAMQYFPQCSANRARRLFTQMVIKNKNLYKELQEDGWSSNLRFLTPRQFDIIVKYIGIP